MATKKAAKKKIQNIIAAWEGTDKTGKKVKGEARGSDINLIRADLRRQGINVKKIRKKSKGLFGGKKPIKPGDIAVFSRQLATMMEAGVPLVQSFEIIGTGHDNESMSELLLTIKADVEAGISLTESLRRHPLYFDDLYCNLVEAGEAAGVLEDLLDKIATFKEKTESIKKKVKGALTYPLAVIAVAVLVTAIIMIFVMPQFEALFSSFGSDLPQFTQIIVAISRVVQDWWWAMLGGFIAFIFVMRESLRRSRKLQVIKDRLLLKIPVIGMILHKAALARFSRTLGTMFTAGVPIVEALESVSGATGNVVYSDAVLRMREDVATGQSLQLSMRQQSLFPHLVIQMVAIGEESGALDTMLGKVADFYEEEVDNAVANMSALMEPLIMVVIGGLVGSLVVGMYLPIFQLGKIVGG